MKNEREGKTEQGSVYSIYSYLYLSLYIRLCLFYNGCTGVYIEKFFPTFLAKKSYDWWITRRRMEIYTKISKIKDLMWSRRNRGDFTPRMGCCAKFKVLCEFHTTWRCCANFKVLCEFRTSLEQLSSEGHIFLISAPNRTWFEALDSWLPEIWNGI